MLKFSPFPAWNIIMMFGTHVDHFATMKQQAQEWNQHIEYGKQENRKNLALGVFVESLYE